MLGTCREEHTILMKDIKDGVGTADGVPHDLNTLTINILGIGFHAH